MLTSRGEGGAESSRPSETALRAKMATMPYSFQQVHPVVPTGRVARPPPLPASNDVRVLRASGDVRVHAVSSDVRAVPAPSAIASVANSSDADAHFPVLSQSVTPPTSVSRAYSSSALAAHSFPPISFSNNTSSSLTTGAPVSSRWPLSSRNPVTAADVVAARPPEPSAQSVEEEMAKKEKTQFAVYAQLVPKTSSIPRAPGRSLGRGGLRATGSVAGQQQQRNAASNVRSPKNAILPPPTLRTRKEHSSNRLTSLTSDATKPQLARRVAPASSKPKALQLPPGMMSLGTHIGSVENPDEMFKSVEPQAVDVPKIDAENYLLRKEDRTVSAAPNSTFSTSVPLKAPLTAPSLRPGGAASSFRVAPSGLAARTAIAAKASSRTFSSLSKSGIESVPSVLKSHVDTPSSQGNTPERPLSPKPFVPPIADVDVMELRRKAFASSPDLKPVKGRNSYHSSRKSQQSNGRRLSHSSSSSTQIGNGVSSQSKSSGPRVDYVAMNGFSNRVTAGNGRGKPANVKAELHTNGVEKDAGFKSTFPDRDVPRGPVVPINSRAEALRDAISASSKKNGFRSDARKAGNHVKDPSSATKPVSRRSVPCLASVDAGKDSQPSSNGLRSRGSRLRNQMDRKPKSVSIPNLVRKQEMLPNTMPANQSFSLPQPMLAREPNSKLDPILSPRELIEEDFPARELSFIPHDIHDVRLPSTIPMPRTMPMPKSAPALNPVDPYNMEDYIDDLPRRINEQLSIDIGRASERQEPYTRSAIDNNYPVPDFQEKLISWMDNEVKDPPSTPNPPGLHQDFGRVHASRRVQRMQGQRDQSAISMIDLMGYIQSRARVEGSSSFRPLRTEPSGNEHFEAMIRKLTEDHHVIGVSVNESRSGTSTMPNNFADEEVSALNANGNSGGVAGPAKAAPTSLFYSHFS